MSLADDIEHSPHYYIDNFGVILSLSEDKKRVKQVEYCMKCGSTNIKTSKVGNKYCGEICRKNQK